MIRIGGRYRFKNGLGGSHRTGEIVTVIREDKRITHPPERTYQVEFREEVRGTIPMTGKRETTFQVLESELEDLP